MFAPDQWTVGSKPYNAGPKPAWHTALATKSNFCVNLQLAWGHQRNVDPTQISYFWKVFNFDSFETQSWDFDWKRTQGLFNPSSHSLFIFHSSYFPISLSPLLHTLPNFKHSFSSYKPLISHTSILTQTSYSLNSPI